MTLNDITMEGLSDQMLELQKDCIKAVQENTLLRKLLWLRHDADHGAGLYGDDGEMACGACGIDFKRLPAVDIEETFSSLALAKLVTAMNQCDGCKAGRPFNSSGHHVMGEPGAAYPDLMACQAHKYKEKP